MTVKPDLEDIKDNVPQTQDLENKDNGVKDNDANADDGVSTDTQDISGAEDEAEGDNPQERNWRKYREQRRVEREQRDQAEKRAEEKAAEAEALKKALESVMDRKPQVPQVQASTGYYDEEPAPQTENIEQKLDKMLDEREQKREEARQVKEMQELPARLSKDFDNFDNVCSQENLDYFDYHYPEISKPFAYMPDSYEKYAAIYKAVKRFVPEAQNNKAKRRAEENTNKPKSASAPGSDQTGDGPPMYLDEQRRQSNWKRMQKVMKGVS